MAVKVKQIKALEKLASAYELDPGKKYFVVIERPLTVQALQWFAKELNEFSPNCKVVAGVPLKIFEIENDKQLLAEPSEQTS